MNSYLSGFKRVKKRSLEFFLETEIGLPGKKGLRVINTPLNLPVLTGYYQADQINEAIFGIFCYILRFLL